MCRRCGAPLRADPEVARLAVPTSLQRRGSVGAGRGVASLSRPVHNDAAFRAASAAAAFNAAPPDTLLPGAFPRPDNLLPRASRSNPAPAARARRPVPTARAARARARTGRISLPRPPALLRDHWRRILVLAIVAVALAMSVVAVRPVVFSRATGSPANAGAPDTRAKSLLRTVVGGGRTLYAPRHSFAKVTPSSLSAKSHKVPVVAATTVARAGQVSLRVTRGVLVIATPATDRRCVFARDEPARSLTQFATVATADCRAASAPAKGWAAR